MPQMECDADALRAALSAHYASLKGDETALRRKVLQEIQTVITDTRAQIEKDLSSDGKGLRCAQRLSNLQDEVIRVLYDFAVVHMYRSRNPSAAEQMAVIAVGGYGRGTLAPGSDIDLLFIRPYKQTPWAESVIEFILYSLWDMGFKVGHATRTVSECIKLAKQDMTIRTAVLEMRFLWGEKSLFDQLEARFLKEVVTGSESEFVSAKLAERETRHRKQGDSRYLVEPDIKDGKGGLRDLQTLFWIAKYAYGVKTGDELVKAGVFSRDDYKTFRKCEDFLWAVRCHLHFFSARPDERLTFDVQRPMAQRLGYITRPGTRDVERFMKHYFLIAKDVGDLTGILCALLEVQHAKAPGVFSKLISRISDPETSKPLGDDGIFTVKAGRVSVANQGTFERDPITMLRAFWVAAEQNMQLHPEALKCMRRSLNKIDAKMRSDPHANQIFMDILTESRDPEQTLRRMNEAGVLGKFFTEFGRIVGLVQFNMYHHYTVDEHLIRSIGVLAEIDRGELADQHPLANRLMKDIAYRRVLYFAMFLHDIAKGRPEDHSIAGAKVAKKLGPRMGFTAQEIETLSWLILHHLDMSSYAQSRDTSDPATIKEFAKIAQSKERLDLLLTLTVADIKAVGPGVWNGWKGQLLRSLYHQTVPMLSGASQEITRADRIDAAQEALANSLPDWAPEAFDEYAARHYPGYWLRVPLEVAREHALLVEETAKTEQKLAIRFTTDSFTSVTSFHITAPDHPSLLSDIAGGCVAAGAHIVDAQIATTVDGMAIDSIDVRKIYSDELEELERAAVVAQTIEAAVRDIRSMADRIKHNRKPKNPRIKAFDLETKIIVSNTISDDFTVVEASGLDRPGLLYDLTRAMRDLNLNIASAHVATFGERAVDVFYVTNLLGEKIVEEDRHTEIKDTLTGAFEGRRKPLEPRKAA